MKKLAVVLVILFVSVFAVAEEGAAPVFQLPSDWLVVEFAFQAGWIPNGNIDFYVPNPEFIELRNPFDATFIVDFTAFDLVKIGGRCSTIFYNAENVGNNTHFLNSPINFWPTGVTYLFYFGIEPFKGVSVKYEHGCSHPEAPFINITQFSGEGRLDVGYDRIYVEIKGKLLF
jgi:hypothetical protein